MENILDMNKITNMVMTTCVKHRNTFNLNTMPHADDCDREICQNQCPLKKMEKEQNEWLKNEFKQRKQEEKELMLIENMR